MKRTRAEFLQPPMQMAGSFGAIAELEYMLTAYFHLRVIAPWDLETIKAKVKRCAAACHFSDNLAEEWEFDAYAAALYRTVCELKHSPIRTGLSDGAIPEGKGRVEYLALLAHEGHGAFGALLRFLATRDGYTPEELCNHPGLMTEDGQTYGQYYDALLDRLRAVFSAMEAEDFSRASARGAMAQGGAETRAMLVRAADEAREMLTAERAVFSGREWPRRENRTTDDAEEIRRRFRAEAMNPLFIEGMAAHGRHGAMALAAYVARGCQWDAICCGLDGWMYEALARTYALHPSVQQWMREVCPGALRHLAGSLVAASRGPRWHASLKTRTELLWLYRSLGATEKTQRVRREREKQA